MTASLSVEATRVKVKHSDESILFGFDFTPLLVSGETLTGTPTVVADVAGLTINSTPLVNTATFADDEGGTVAIGKAVQCRISGGTNGSDYTLTATCGTSASNTRVVVGVLQVRNS